MPRVVLPSSRFFKYKNATGAKIRGSQLQLWVGCDSGLLNYSSNFLSIFGFPQNVNCWFLFKQSYMFASQLVDLPWQPCKSTPQQASNLQFPLQVHWHIGMMECHLCFTQMLAREDSSLHFSWVWGSAVFFGECVSLISAAYHIFIFPSILTLVLADDCRHP